MNFEDGHLEAQYEDRFVSEDFSAYYGFDDEVEGDDYPEPDDDDLDDGPYHFIMPGTENW